MKGEKKLTKRAISVLSVYNVTIAMFLVMYMTNICVTLITIVFNIYMLRVYRRKGLLYMKYYSKLGRYSQEIQIGVLLIICHLYMSIPLKEFYVDFGLVFLLTFMYWGILRVSKKKVSYMALLGLFFTMYLIKSALYQGFTVDIMIIVLAIVGIQIYNGYKNKRQHYLTKLSNVVVHLSTLIIVISIYSPPYFLLLVVLTISIINLNPQSTYSTISRYIR